MYLYGKRHHFCKRTADLALVVEAERVQVNTPAELRPLFDRLEDRMRVLGYPCKDLFAVLLAVQEATDNAFRHGNRSDPTKSFYVLFLVTAVEVLVEVQDEGRGFDPEQVPDPLAEENLDRPHGRGLFLMRAYMTWVSFNRQGNRVTLARQRSDP
jgi:serine/threonine-protein kinase RsbW